MKRTTVITGGIGGSVGLLFGTYLLLRPRLHRWGATDAVPVISEPSRAAADCDRRVPALGRLGAAVDGAWTTRYVGGRPFT